MVLTFCGHSNCFEDRDYVSEIYKVLENNLSINEEVTFLLGDYGMFDRYARRSCYDYKKLNNKVKVIFVSPYSDDRYIKKREADLDYDEIITPEINCLPKFRLIKRNQYMVDKSDLIISYVNYPFGGSFKTLKYAKHSGKKIINLGKL